MSSQLIFKTGNGIIQTGNGIIYPSSRPMIKNTSFIKCFLFSSKIPNGFPNRKKNDLNRKWNNPNRKWNYFSYFQASDEILLLQHVAKLQLQLQL